MQVGIIGVTGRMGQILKDLILSSENYSFAGGVSSKSTKSELEETVVKSDIIVDFSTPAATFDAVFIAANHKKPFITGTTGFSVEDMLKIRSYSRSIPLLHSNNFSTGIQLMAVLLEKSSSILANFDFSIIERHHKRKKDIPSGTALFLENRASHKAQIVSLREGNIFGDHICEFVSDNEIFTLSHSALNRRVFAEGAINCANWLVRQTPGFFTIRDYLSEKINI